MHTHMHLTERDTIDVVTYLKKQDLTKEEKVGYRFKFSKQILKILVDGMEKVFNCKNTV